MEIKRNDIVKAVISSGLVETCVAYQMNKCTDEYLKEEMIQECYLWLETYDWDKLFDSFIGNHMNALITKFIKNQWFSSTSTFYRRNRKKQKTEVEIDNEALQIKDESILYAE